MLSRCKMLWYNTKNRDLGISDENDHRWVDTVLDWSGVVMICEAEPEDESLPDYGMTNIFFRNGEYFTINIPYKDAELRFREQDVELIF